jgi:hypothetical protein
VKVIVKCIKLVRAIDCSDGFIKAYDICQIGLRMVVYPQIMNKNNIVSLFEAFKI